MNGCVTGLEQLKNDKKWINAIKGNVAYVYHSASVDSELDSGDQIVYSLFGSRLAKFFGPQHGAYQTEQDNMKETRTIKHPDLYIPLESLYSEDRMPTKEMLNGVDTIIFDLQDVGVRVYTYIQTLALIMKAINQTQIELVILDRPNPVGGIHIEGPVLDMSFSTFVGLFPVPMRHGLTMGEMAKWIKNHFNYDFKLDIVPMLNWQRQHLFPATNLPYILPSPNLPNFESIMLYSGLVGLEGTMISEGRGTTKPFEILGHPGIKNPYDFSKKLKEFWKNQHHYSKEFINIRPCFFIPTFNKHAKMVCGGIQLHINYQQCHARSVNIWALGTSLTQFFYNYLKELNVWEWKAPPYEYEYKLLPFNCIQGTDRVFRWIEQNNEHSKLLEINVLGHEKYIESRDNVLMYS